jgi:hypothetical protein
MPCWKYALPRAERSSGVRVPMRDNRPAVSSVCSAASKRSRRVVRRGSGMASTRRARARASLGASGTSWRQQAPQPARQEIGCPSASLRAHARSENKLLKPRRIGSSASTVTGPFGTVSSSGRRSPFTTSTTRPVWVSSPGTPADRRTGSS